MAPAIALLTVLAAAGGWIWLRSEGGSTHSLTGRVEVRAHDSDWYLAVMLPDGPLGRTISEDEANELDCPALPGGLSDLRDGAEVAISRADGKTVALGRLRDGTYFFRPHDAYGCTFTFDVDVPSSDFYEIHVGDRDGVTFEGSELETLQWQVELTIG